VHANDAASVYPHPRPCQSLDGLEAEPLDLRIAVLEGGPARRVLTKHSN
jgi:hypothetical protein